MKNISLLLIVIFSTVTSGFPSSPMTGWNDVYTRTHRDMLNSGLKKATGNYLKNKYLEDDLSNVPLREVVNVFFGNDSDGRKKYDESVDNIFISLEKQEMLSEPHFHCNAEQFLEAHTYIIYLRNIISELAKDGDPNIALLQEYIGKILYTLQSFYSSSNWVEMDGNKTYRDFGVPGKTIIPIAADDVDTCSDCDNSGKFTDSCKDNLLLTNMLTSGYHSKQDILPPRRSAGATSGKCGFGGSSDDNNGVTTARGGLNKDQDNPSYSPHHHLHYNAYSAANEATFQFFIDPEIGIINELTNEVFGTLFQLHRREKGSLGFAIDVTWSMSDEIAEVKKYCIDYITTIRGTTNEPTDYILTTFSDPESQTELVIKTNDGIEMITAINSLGLQSGGDCPEHAMDGLEACIQACQPYSTILVFTDADAKDKSRKDFVINFAVKASITVDFVLTGKCERKRRSTDRYKRLTSIFDDIAYATGGNVYRITTSEIFTVMKTVVEERFPSASAIIDTITFEKTSNTNVTFNVDSFVQNIRIEITGPYDTLEVDLTYSGDSIIESGLATVFFYPPNTVIITAIRPTSGNYTVQRKIVRDWLINITAQTNLDFKYYISEQYDNGNWYRTSANPAFSESYIIQVVVYDPYVNVSLLEIILTDNNGCKEHLNVTLISSEDTIGVYAKAFFTSEEYQVSIAGYDAVGNEFIRTSSKKIRAVTVKLETVSPTELFAGAITTISYSLTNTGTNNDTFVVSFIDNRGFLTGPSTASHTLSNGASVTGSFKMQSQSTCKTVTYELNVQPFGSNVILQKESKSVFVSLNSPPSCIIYNVVGNCSRQFKKGVCLSNMWYGQAILTFDSALRYVKGTPRLNIEIGSQNLSSSPFYVNASGDCCTPTSYVTAIDTNNYMIKCSFNLGEPIYLSRSQPNVSEEAKLAVGVISGIILLVIIVTICIVILIFRVGVKPKLEARKIHDMTVKACSNLPARSENIAKERFNGSYSVLTADSLSVQFT